MANTAGQWHALMDCYDRHRRETKERRRVFNELQQRRGNIRVICRVRPLWEKEKKKQGGDG